MTELGRRGCGGVVRNRMTSLISFSDDDLDDRRYVAFLYRP